MTVRMLAACGATLVALAGFSLSNVQEAAAASAVTKDAKTGAFGYCTGADDPYAAMMCAQKNCEAAGGRDCQVVEGCPTPGHGAVARDRGARAIGSSCGKKTVAEARSAAMQACVAQKGTNCTIVEIFSDTGGSGASAAAAAKQTAKAGAAQKMATAAKPAADAASPPTPAQAAKPPTKLMKSDPPASGPAATEPAAGPTAKQAAAVPPPETPKKTEPAPATGTLSPQEQAERKTRTQAVVDSLRERSERRQQALAPINKEQAKLADKLIGVWSSQSCAEKFWRISKAGNQRYDVFVWYEDGQEDKTSFRVSFENDVMVLTWNTRLPNQTEELKRGRRYVEKIGKLEDNSYTVVENNYKDFRRPWTVRRCTQKR